MHQGPFATNVKEKPWLPGLCAFCHGYSGYVLCLLSEHLLVLCFWRAHMVSSGHCKAAVPYWVQVTTFVPSPDCPICPMPALPHTSMQWYCSPCSATARGLCIAETCCRSIYSNTAIGRLQSSRVGVCSQPECCIHNQAGRRVVSRLHSSGLSPGQVCTSPIRAGARGMRSLAHVAVTRLQ